MHPVMIVVRSIAIQSVPLPALAKFVLFVPVAVLAAFATGHLMRALPGARRRATKPFAKPACIQA
jgi:hypothetical protein